MKFESNLHQTNTRIEDWEIAALNAIGQFVDSKAVSLCPVDTGNLRSSLRFYVDEDKKEVVIGTDVEYATSVEKGDGKQRAQPYLTPAAEDNIGEIQKIIKKVKFKYGVS